MRARHNSLCAALLLTVLLTPGLSFVTISTPDGLVYADTGAGSPPPPSPVSMIGHSSDVDGSGDKMVGSSSTAISVSEFKYFYTASITSSWLVIKYWSVVTSEWRMPYLSRPWESSMNRHR